MTLSHAMVYKQARKTEDMGDLLELGVMREEEWEALKPSPSNRFVIYNTPRRSPAPVPAPAPALDLGLG
eukprot:tig00021290_g19968.t1